MASQAAPRSNLRRARAGDAYPPPAPSRVPAQRQFANAMGLGFLTMSIAHEVNQPLSGIITNASTCIRMLDADPPNLRGVRETVRRTIRDAYRCAEVIARLRALVVKKEGACGSLDLNATARDAIADCADELRAHRAIVRLELADQLPAVAGDRVQLQQVILNLVRNAAQSMRAVHDRPRELTLRTEADADGRVRLSVKDAGAGFALDSHDRLFEAFYTTKPGGMGMGLAISRTIIERHGGRLWATGNDGPGATFSFAIPHAAQVRLPYC